MASSRKGLKRKQGSKASSRKRVRRDTTASSPKIPEHYAREYSRVGKDDLYMMIALLMENYVDAKAPKGYHKVGAVLVLANDIVQAAECSRGGDHAVVRLLMKHHDKTEGCKIFVSRKPCPTCTKLLVQSKVNRVLFQPFEPEYYPSPKKDSMMTEVDNLFTASSIAVTRFVLQVKRQVIDDSTEKLNAKVKRPNRYITQPLLEKINRERDGLFEEYGFESCTAEWSNVNAVKQQLPWPGFDKEIKATIETDFSNAMECIARAKILRGSGLDYTLAKAQKKEYEDHEEIEFQQESDEDFLEKVRHFVTIARLLAERTDDPRSGVGAVIVNKDMEIISFGWNGFPRKTRYGELPRASKKDTVAPDKKDSYVIHAEQNAFLFKNQKDIKGSIMFVTRNPCDMCASMIAMHGVGTVVVDPDDGKDVNTRGKEKGYKEFLRLVKEDKFICYQTQIEITRCISLRNRNVIIE